MATRCAIHGVDLSAFINEGTTGRTKSVIVEARRPPVRAASAAPPRLATSPRELLPASPKAGAKKSGSASVKKKTPLAETMGEVEQALKRLGLDSCARRNNLSGSFVVEVTPQQLRELASTPAVQAIRPNRLHRKAA